MRVDAVLVRAVVIRRHVQRRIGAGLFGVARQLDRVSRIVRSAAGDDRHAAAGNLDGDLDHPPMLVGRERRRLAGRSARDQRIRALVDLPLDERSECVLGDTARRKWSHQRRNRAEKHELISSAGSFLWRSWPRSLADKERDCKMSSMWRAALLIPLLVGTVSASAQYSAPYAYRPAPTYAAPSRQLRDRRLAPAAPEQRLQLRQLRQFPDRQSGLAGRNNHAPMGRTGDAPGRKRGLGARLLRRRTSRRPATALPGSPMLMRPAGG